MGLFWSYIVLINIVEAVLSQKKAPHQKLKHTKQPDTRITGNAQTISSAPPIPIPVSNSRTLKATDCIKACTDTGLHAV